MTNGFMKFRFGCYYYNPAHQLLIASVGLKKTESQAQSGTFIAPFVEWSYLAAVHIYLQPSVEWFGIRIDEPVTVATDLVLAAINLYAFLALRKHRPSSTLNYLRWYFLLMTFATALGGLIGHGFLYALSTKWKFPGWFLSMVSINLLERAMISWSRGFLKGNQHHFFSAFNIIELLVFTALAFTTLNFRFVEAHTAYGVLVFVAGFAIFNYRKRGGHGRAAARYLLYAVAFAAVGGLFFIFRLGMDEWFTHADTSHVFLWLSTWSFYRAAKAMSEPKAEKAVVLSST